MLHQHQLNPQGGKALTWIMLVLLFASTLGAYWFFNPAQQPDWFAEWLPTAANAEITLYRWQGADGERVISSEPPPDGVDFEVVNYRHDTNVVPAVEPAGDNE